MCTGFWWGGQQDREHLEDPGVDWNIRKWDVGTWIGSIGAGQGQVEGTCEGGNEPPGSTK